jgi:hypothetical protein
MKPTTKKPIFAVLTAAAVLTMACICCPGFSLPISFDPTPEDRATEPPYVVTEPPVVTEAAASPSESDSVCARDLSQVLDQAENGSYGDDVELNEAILVKYKVNGDSISDPYIHRVPPNLVSYQEDITAQEDIWRFFTDVIPAEQRTMVSSYVVYTDGTGGSLGAVEQTDDPALWMFEMDIMDGADFPTMSTTMIHEFGHLLTLNQSQVPTDTSVFYNPDDEAIYDREEAACSTYFSFEGCSFPDSYVNRFFQRFWPDIYDEWKLIYEEDDPDRLDTKLTAFYEEYPDQFVTDYAVTDPSEDIAESFMYFIFTPQPAGETIADQKVLFFYEYPELVALRGEILSKLCTYVENR